MPTKFAAHPNTKSTNIERKNNLLAINFHQWGGCGCFSEIKSFIPGFAADDAHPDHLLSQRLFQGFVFMFTSVENPLSYIRQVDENGSAHVATLPILLYICAQLQHISFESVLNKHAPLKELCRTEMEFRSKPWLTKGILLKPKIHYIKKEKNVIHQKAFSDIKCTETV